MRRRTLLAWDSLEQVSDQVSLGVGQISAVERNVFAPVCRRVAVALGSFIGRRGKPVASS